MSSFPNDPFLVYKRLGTKSDPFYLYNEPKQVFNGKVILTELPDKSQHVTVTDGTNTYAEVTSQASLSANNVYYVDYDRGIVYFDSSKDGLKLTFNYQGIGGSYIPATRVYTQSANGTVTQDVQDMINNYNQLNGTDLYRLFDPQTGHKHTGASGDAPQIDAQYVTYSGNGVTSTSNVKSTLDTHTAQLAEITYLANSYSGVDNTGVNDSSTAIQNAINYASSNGFKRIKFVGKYRIDKVVNLSSDLIYDLRDAQFYASTNATAISSSGYVFYGNNISDFLICGGKWLQDANTLSVNDMTGSYANYAPFMLTGCDNFTVTKMYGGRLHVGINIYNCSNFSINHNYSEDGNAFIAVVAQTGYTASGGDIHDNIIIRCGDDGIFVGSQGGICEHMDIHDNIITKTTRSNGELNGSTTAALGIRIGEYGAGHTTTSKNIHIHHNTLVDMVNGAIFAHDCDTVLIESNIIDGYAKNNSTASPAIQIGEVGMIAYNTKALHNIIKNAYTNNAEFKLGDTNNVLLKGNDFLGGSNRTTKLIKTGTQTNVRIKDNIGYVTENYGSGAAFPYTATSFAFVHGLDDITGIEIEVYPMMRMGNAHTVSVTNITATAFTIALDQVTGDTNNPTFNWRARSNQ